MHQTPQQLTNLITLEKVKERRRFSSNVQQSCVFFGISSRTKQSIFTWTGEFPSLVRMFDPFDSKSTRMRLVSRWLCAVIDTDDVFGVFLLFAACCTCVVSFKIVKAIFECQKSSNSGKTGETKKQSRSPALQIGVFTLNFR
jgi:hypothetical protein